MCAPRCQLLYMHVRVGVCGGSGGKEEGGRNAKSSLLFLKPFLLHHPHEATGI